MVVPVQRYPWLKVNGSCQGKGKDRDTLEAVEFIWPSNPLVLFSYSAGYPQESVLLVEETTVLDDIDISSI